MGVTIGMKFMVPLTDSPELTLLRQYNRLFLILNNFRPTSTLVSSDLGNTWGSITISQPITDSQTTGITFLSDSIGLASWSAFYPDTTCGFLRTMDGGLAWTLELTPFT